VPDYVTTRAPFNGSPTFQTGGDLTIAWSLNTGSTSTGAGGSGAGGALGAPLIPGLVEIELRTTGDVFRDTLETDADSFEYTITNAALVAAFSGEPTAYKVRVRHTANGHPSDWSPYITITRV
jgi:hypothetical protein